MVQWQGGAANSWKGNVKVGFAACVSHGDFGVENGATYWPRISSSLPELGHLLTPSENRQVTGNTWQSVAAHAMPRTTQAAPRRRRKGASGAAASVAREGSSWPCHGSETAVKWEISTMKSGETWWRYCAKSWWMKQFVNNQYQLLISWFQCYICIHLLHQLMIQHG